MPDKRICGTCRWHVKDMDDDWICVNHYSEEYGDYTPYGHTCEGWEEKT